MWPFFHQKRGGEGVDSGGEADSTLVLRRSVRRASTLAPGGERAEAYPGKHKVGSDHQLPVPRRIFLTEPDRVHRGRLDAPGGHAGVVRWSR